MSDRVQHHLAGGLPGSRLCRPLAPALGLLLAFAAFLAPPGMAAADGWTGQVQCVLKVNTADYQREETQTWVLAAEPPKKEGAFWIHNATWSVLGKGSVTKSNGAQRISTSWTVKVAPTPVKLATFIRASDQRWIVRQWSSPARVPRCVEGTRRTTVDGQPQPEVKVTADATEWVFPWIEADTSRSSLTGTATIIADALPAEFSAPGPVARHTAACTWTFVRPESARPPTPTPRATAPAAGPSVPATPATTTPAPTTPAPATSVPASKRIPTAPPASPKGPEPKPSNPDSPAAVPVGPSTPPADSATSTQRIAGVYLSEAPANVRPWILLFGSDGRFAGEGIEMVIRDPACPHRARGTYEIRGDKLTIAFENGFSTVIPIRLEGVDSVRPRKVVLNGVAFERERTPPAPLVPAASP